MIPRVHPFFQFADLAGLLRCLGDADLHERCARHVGEITGLRHVLFFPFARSAIRSVLCALGLKGRRVVVPGYTCKVVPAAVVLSGNIPDYHDVDAGDWNLCAAPLPLLAEDLGAVIPTMTYGLGTTDVAAYKALAGRGVTVIEDAAMAFGRGKFIALDTENSCAVFSFNLGKTMCSCEGGAFATNDPELYDKVRRYHEAHFAPMGAGYAAMLLAKYLTVLLAFNEAVYPLVARAKDTVWFKANVTHDTQGPIAEGTFRELAMSRLQLAILETQLNKHAQEEAARGRLARFYREALAGIPGLAVPGHLAGITPSSFPVLVGGGRKDTFTRQLRAHGVEHYPAWDYHLRQIKEYNLLPENRACPVSERLAGEIVCLPFYASLSPAAATKVARACADIARGFEAGREVD